MAISAPDLQAYLLAIKETGATRCQVDVSPDGSFTMDVSFQVAPEEPKVQPVQVVPIPQRVVQSPAGKAEGYHKAFHGQLPGFKQAPVAAE
jgi:hypothetical protein